MVTAELSNLVAQESTVQGTLKSESPDAGSFSLAECLPSISRAEFNPQHGRGPQTALIRPLQTVSRFSSSTHSDQCFLTTFERSHLENIKCWSCSSMVCNTSAEEVRGKVISSSMRPSWAGVFVFEWCKKCWWSSELRDTGSISLG